MCREYRCQEAQDPEQGKRRDVCRDRKYVSRMKLLAAQGTVRRTPLAQQLHPCIDEQQERRRKTWRENQRARHARVRAASAAEDATGTVAASFEVSSGCSPAGGKTTVWRCVARHIYIYVADPLAVSLHPHRSSTYIS